MECSITVDLCFFHTSKHKTISVLAIKFLGSPWEHAKGVTHKG